MVVIAIVALLAAVAVPAYQDHIIRAEIATLNPSLQNVLAQGQELYSLNGEFPYAEDNTAIVR